MRFLIVNADDFGASPGVNRGVIEAHERGILSSASLLVDTPWSQEAAALSRAAPGLSIGLHFDISTAERRPMDRPADAENLRSDLLRQIDRFDALINRLPTHLDCHHNLHRDPRLLPDLLELAQRFHLPLREHSAVRYCSKFYGQWDGETHLEQISPDGLRRLLDTEITDGFTELACHPGYVDEHLQSRYAMEREVELRTLCDPRVWQILCDQSVLLADYHDLTGALVPGT